MRCCGRKAIRLKFVSGSICKVEPDTQASFYGVDLFPRSKPVSTEQACFYGEGLFPRSRPVSTTSRPISTEQAYFYGAGLFRAFFKRLAREAPTPREIYKECNLKLYKHVLCAKNVTTIL